MQRYLCFKLRLGKLPLKNFSIGIPMAMGVMNFSLVDGEYEVQQFRGGDRLISIAFPQLTLTAEQIFNSGKDL